MVDTEIELSYEEHAFSTKRVKGNLAQSTLFDFMQGEAGDE